jgi:hypothetical protein
MSQPLRVAGFELITSGRFWVIAKVEAMSALLCFQNRTGGSPPEGGGFFNQHYGDFCISRDTPSSACSVVNAFGKAARMGT